MSAAYDAAVLSSERPIADYFEAVAHAGAESKTAANWILGEGMPGYNETGSFAVTPANLATLIALQGRLQKFPR